MLADLLHQTLPFAVAIAFSPIPGIAVIVMLLSSRGVTGAACFGAGWLAGIALATVAVMVLVPVEAAYDVNGGVWVGVALFILGAVLIAVGIRAWQTRPRPGDKPKLPKWMLGIDKMSIAQSIGIGAALAVLNPRNLPLILAGGLGLSQSLSVGNGTWSVMLFVLLSGVGVIVPVLMYVAAKNRFVQALETWKDWLSRNNATVIFVVTVIMGVTIVADSLPYLLN